MYPVDTVKTLMQVRQQQQCTLERAVQRGGAAGSSSVAAAACSCANCGTPLDVALQLWRSQGGFRLWRGVQTTFTGCIPAHAAYFATYEGLKPVFTAWLISFRVLPAVPGGSSAGGPAGGGANDSSHAMGAGAAVAVGTVAHDMIMTPMDVCKQRMQLSSSSSTVYDCACNIMKTEGPRAFYVSYPITLLMNLPYALIMGTSNEALRQLLSPSGEPSSAAYLVAGAGSGATAAALTNPFDVVKTRLQTQHLAGPAVEAQPAGAALSRGVAAGPGSRAGNGKCGAAPGCGGSSNNTGGGPAGTSAGSTGTGAEKTGAAPVGCPRRDMTYRGFVHAAQSIWRQEGYRGFLRGVSARMLVHAPSVAISWTTYETVKAALERMGM
jgi:solute carrier family 25 iron transporter 28/37